MAASPQRHIVAIGASAGGVEAILRLFDLLPALPSTVFLVALHYPAGAQSVLPELLSRRSGMRASHPAPGEQLREGHIFVAPPDRHIFIDGACVRTDSGPKENRQRPSIDRLFRSAAAYDGRTTGVVLSGALRDGALGLRAIVESGGQALIQDPSEAAFGGMPLAAADAAAGATVMPLEEIAAAIAADDPGNGSDALESLAPAEQPPPREGKPSAFICPDCHGTLFELPDGGYACRVGHRFSPGNLLDALDDSVEAALWAAVRVLQERHDMTHRIAESLRGRGSETASEYFAQRAREAKANADVISQLISESKHPTGAAQPAPSDQDD